MSASIYIIEDHALMREMLSEFVAREDDLYICGTSASAEEALRQIPVCTPDLVLIDVSLPTMSGIDLVRKLRSQQPDLLCLMLSGHAEPVYVNDALEAGARGYVMKGDPHLLLQAIRTVLNGETYTSNQLRTDF